MKTPMRAYNYTGHSAKGWLMSEKLDGMRATWDGSHLWSKQGNRIDAPEIAATLPLGVRLDGELWAGRGQFERVVSAINGGDWSGVRFVAFDLIDAESTAKQRRESLDTLPVESVEYEVCTGKRHLRALEAAVKAKGGEGVMIVKPSSKYQHCKTLDVQKVKTADISECAVMGWNGKSLDVQFKGKPFKVFMGAKRSLSKKETVLVSHYGYTGTGLPRHAVVLG